MASMSRNRLLSLIISILHTLRAIILQHDQDYCQVVKKDRNLDAQDARLAFRTIIKAKPA